MREVLVRTSETAPQPEHLRGYGLVEKSLRPHRCSSVLSSRLHAVGYSSKDKVIGLVVSRLTLFSGRFTTAQFAVAVTVTVRDPLDVRPVDAAFGILLSLRPGAIVRVTDITPEVAGR